MPARPGDIPDSLVSPYDRALHLARRIEALQQEAPGEWCDAEIERLRELVREIAAESP